MNRDSPDSGETEAYAQTGRSDLVERLRGTYRIPITDGLGPAGGEEPDNADFFVRTFPTSPLALEAAAALTAQDAEIARLRADNAFLHRRRGELVIERDNAVHALMEWTKGDGPNQDLLEQVGKSAMKTAIAAAEIERLREALQAYETWEANLLINAEWGGEFPGGMRALPRFTYELWDELMECQTKRNAALGGKP